MIQESVMVLQVWEIKNLHLEHFYRDQAMEGELES